LVPQTNWEVLEDLYGTNRMVPNSGF